MLYHTKLPWFQCQLRRFNDKTSHNKKERTHEAEGSVDGAHKRMRKQRLEKTGGTDSKDFVQENDLPKYPVDGINQGSQSGAQYKRRIYPQAFTCGNQSLREKV